MFSPRIYAQSTDDQAALDAFFCAGVGYILSCPKFETGECWKRFDDLGLVMGISQKPAQPAKIGQMVLILTEESVVLVIFRLCCALILQQCASR